MNIEYIFSKLSLKSTTITSNSAGGRPTLTAEDQIGILAMCKNKNPVGFAVLMLEHTEDDELKKYLEIKFLDQLTNFRGSYNKEVCSTLASLLVEEVKAPQGRPCGECNGTGLQQRENKNEHRPCQACEAGRVQWDDNTRYGFFMAQTAISVERFKKYTKHYNIVKEALLLERDKAHTIIEDQVKKELEELAA